MYQNEQKSSRVIKGDHLNEHAVMTTKIEKLIINKKQNKNNNFSKQSNNNVCLDLYSTIP